MKKRTFLWLGLSFLLVVALVLIGYLPPAPVVEPPEVLPADVPRFGGTLTYISRPIAEGGSPNWAWLGWPGHLHFWPVLEYPFGGYIEKYGPRGTGEFRFAQDDWIPIEFSTGRLAESWEVHLNKIVFHIRPGIYWTGKSINPGVMERRRYTAHDFVFNVKGMIGALPGHPMGALIEDVYAVNDYKVVIHTTHFDPEWWQTIFPHGANHRPPEMVEAGIEDWGNMVGTGPFILTEYVPASHFTFKRNPDYWRTTTIDGIEYQIPFIDELVLPMVPDLATNVALLRTAQIDIHHRIPPPFGPELARHAPELIRGYAIPGNPMNIYLRVDIPPFDCIIVRRAFFIGTDRESLHEAVFGGVGEIYSWPLMKGVPGHVPLEELPPETRMLWEFNPELARQMLAEAGFPDGFNVHIHGCLHPEVKELGPMIAGLWEADLGLEVELTQFDYVVFRDFIYAGKHEVAITWGLPMLPFTGLRLSYMNPWTPSSFNFSKHCCPYFDELFKRAKATICDVQRTAMLEKLFIMGLDSAAIIPISHYFSYTFWWPWVRNYYGETAQVCLDPPLDLVWLDLEMRARMGF